MYKLPVKISQIIYLSFKSSLHKTKSTTTTRKLLTTSSCYDRNNTCIAQTITSKHRISKTMNGELSMIIEPTGITDQYTRCEWPSQHGRQSQRIDYYNHHFASSHTTAYAFRINFICYWPPPKSSIPLFNWNTCKMQVQIWKQHFNEVILTRRTEEYWEYWGAFLRQRCTACNYYQWTITGF